MDANTLPTSHAEHQPITERWADVAGYPGYRVSTAGRVQTKRHRNGLPAAEWRELRHGHDGRGYPQVRLYPPRGTGKPRWRHVHILVLQAFVGPCPDGQVARHGPAGCADPGLGNLSYGTMAENMADKWRDGTAQTAAKWRTYWTRAESRAVYERFKAGETIGAIAADLGVIYNRVQQAIKRERGRESVKVPA